MSGFFPIMMFGLVGAALAMYQEAKPSQRKVVGSIPSFSSWAVWRRRMSRSTGRGGSSVAQAAGDGANGQHGGRGTLVSRAGGRGAGGDHVPRRRGTACDGAGHHDRNTRGGAARGTNDLTQYTLAVDRLNPGVAGLYDALHPAILRLIAQVVDGARRHGRWVGICGELAGDPLAAPLRADARGYPLRARRARAHVEHEKTSRRPCWLISELCIDSQK